MHAHAKPVRLPPKRQANPDHVTPQLTVNLPVWAHESIAELMKRWRLSKSGTVLRLVVLGMMNPTAAHAPIKPSDDCRQLNVTMPVWAHEALAGMMDKSQLSRSEAILRLVVLGAETA